MAADLIMPTLPGHQNPQFNHFNPRRPQHMRSQSYHISSTPQISPLSTSDSNSNSSTPASPKSHHTRQVRPLYMPAALRPNEYSSKKARCCKPDGSLCKPDDASSLEGSDEYTLRRNNNSLLALPGMSVFGHRLTRSSTGESSKSSLDGDFDLEMFPEVTDLPTRSHWKPDVESSVCDDPTCKRTFNYFTRRHHCRKCGNIFCDSHSTFTVPLDQDAKFNPRAMPSRTCKHCFEEYKSWHSRNNSQASSSAGSDVPQTPTTPIAAMPGKGEGLPHGPEAAASVPRDWNWSTF